MSLWQRCKKGLFWSALALFSFHLATQTYHTARALYYTAYPTEIRRSFAEKFGFPLQGYDIEETNSAAQIAAVLHKEKMEMDFSLDAIYIRSFSYLQKPIHEQFFSMVGTGNGGYCYNKFVVLQSPVWEGTVHHEIKHAKAYAIWAAHPEFIEKWEALAKGKNGQSLYLSPQEDWCYDYKGLRNFVREQNKKEDEKLGFVSSYARRNSDEDIAELCEEAELKAPNFIPWLYTAPNQRIQAKTRLAEQYQLIPPYFSAYVFVLSQQKELFMKTSDDFLKRHQKSIYEGSLRKNRGKFLEEKALQLQIKEYADKAMEEYKNGICAPYKNIDVYPELLENIAECASHWKDERTATLYRNALEEYRKRENANDLSLSINGVTDYLLAHGEKF